MGAEYVNRKDQRYYLLQGRTKTGKPKYYCSRKPSGVPVAVMPEGYEWRESPEEGIVSIRKVRPSRIASIEREMLIRGIREQAGLDTFLVDIAGDSLVAYIPDRNPDEVASAFGTRFGLGDAQGASMAAWTAKHMHYSAMMRFVLREEDERLFDAERWCFRGSVDGWIFLEGAAPLPSLIDEYVRHLGRESFFDLI